MHTRGLMSASASLLAAAGAALIFLPGEIAAAPGESGRAVPLLLQLAGALYFGFALLNWTARGSLLGGIYSRPIVLANFFYFTTATLTLLRHISGPGTIPALALAIHGAFALWFGRTLFSPTPTRARDGDEPVNS